MPTQLSLADDFIAPLAGMTNEQIIDFLVDKPANYVDNTLINHSGNWFDPVKFYFDDGSILYIDSWEDDLEIPKFQVYAPRLTNNQLIELFLTNSQELKPFMDNLLETLNCSLFNIFKPTTIVQLLKIERHGAGLLLVFNDLYCDESLFIEPNSAIFSPKPLIDKLRFRWFP